MRQKGGLNASVVLLSGAALWAVAPRTGSSFVAPPLGTSVGGRQLRGASTGRPRAGAGAVAADSQSASSLSSSSWRTAAGLAGALVLATSAATRSSRVARAVDWTGKSGSAQQVAVLDMDGKQIGEETLHFKTFSAETANYVVHHVYRIWYYMNLKPWPWFAQRQDMKNGRKPWKQKGSGRARHGSFASPLFGKVKTNKYPHGLDNKRLLKIRPSEHMRAMSTVLQSKWKKMKVIDGLEDWNEARMGKLLECLENWTGYVAGSRSVLLITRNGYGEALGSTCTFESYDNPLFLSGRHIPHLTMRRPRDIDIFEGCDGLHELLKARHVIMSREAFYDLAAKFGEKGWAWRSERTILVENLQKIVKDFPMNRAEELHFARRMPIGVDARIEWARARRSKMEDLGRGAALRPQDADRRGRAHRVGPGSTLEDGGFLDE
eukprot:CAMPEP_0177464558 /NCGR_PEP_ID=MMETSP0369-20130122/16937_1 /TAXON_ID=447022 ORGANISM="Scrippsiella hangoei-like, Strain SHHI-4" /NCGR_SAMPLE_ID=MMETSP0369 /ASSEMBLY_ACC=CAM_ASM_000364 /LENGTH=434 /DNA_ID=CAMNT_0018938369 /DNA_START=47 /DNA_END=1348 /DNA_ORIENTATION=+